MLAVGPAITLAMTLERLPAGISTLYSGAAAGGTDMFINEAERLGLLNVRVQHATEPAPRTTTNTPLRPAPSFHRQLRRSAPTARAEAGCGSSEDKRPYQ